MLLAIDTSTSAITVALLDQGQVLAESSVVDARAHGELVAPGIAAVLDQAGATAQDVTAVVAGRGPGPFTGLRVGLVRPGVRAGPVVAAPWPVQPGRPGLCRGGRRAGRWGRWRWC